MTVRPATTGEALPELVLASRQMVVEEAEAMRTALGDVSSAPQPGCPHELDGKAWSQVPGSQGERRLQLLGLTQHQARLIGFNSYDHLISLARVLGNDGAMSVMAHSSLSRIACEAAVRFAWIIDSDISSEERIMRGAVALLVSADERLRGVMKIPAGRFDPGLRQSMINDCTEERNRTRLLITEAGLRLVPNGDGMSVIT